MSESVLWLSIIPSSHLGCIYFVSVLPSAQHAAATFPFLTYGCNGSQTEHEAGSSLSQQHQGFCLLLLAGLPATNHLSVSTQSIFIHSWFLPLRASRVSSEIRNDHQSLKNASANLWGGLHLSSRSLAHRLAAEASSNCTESQWPGLCFLSLQGQREWSPASWLTAQSLEVVSY